MPLRYLDRVLETFTTTGTGDIITAGAVTGYQGWSALDDQDTAPYCAADLTSGAWEVGTALIKKAPAQDTSFSSVAVLCHADGTNLSTTFSNDATMTGKPTLSSTNSSLVYITTAEKKFGTGSMRFPTADSAYCAVLLSPTSALNIGTGDFTAEMFVKRLAGTGSVSGTLFDYEGAIQGSTNANSFAISMYSSGLYFQKAGGSAGVGTYACSVGDGSWHHVAWSRTSGVSKFFYDGTQLDSFTDTTSYNQTAAKGITLGGNATVGADSSLNSRSCIDEFRLTIGVGRYTSAFTPTSTIFGANASSGAVSLERAPTKSSNANALVNFATGTKQVFLAPTATFFEGSSSSSSGVLFVPKLADMAVSASGATVSPNGNYSTGSNFFATCNLTLNGARVFWNSSSPQNVKLKVYLNGSSTAADTVTMSAISNAAKVNAMFSTPIAIPAGTLVKFALWETGGTSVGVFSGMTSLPMKLVIGTGALAITGENFYGSGDVNPTTVDTAPVTVCLHPLIS